MWPISCAAFSSKMSRRTYWAISVKCSSPGWTSRLRPSVPGILGLWSRRGWSAERRCSGCLQWMCATWGLTPRSVFPLRTLRRPVMNPCATLRSKCAICRICCGILRSADTGFPQGSSLRRADRLSPMRTNCRWAKPKLLWCVGLLLKKQWLMARFACWAMPWSWMWPTPCMRCLAVEKTRLWRPCLPPFPWTRLLFHS